MCGNDSAAQFIAIATDVLNDVFAITCLDFTAQAADGFLQGARVVEFGIESHNAGDFIMTEQPAMDQCLKDFHFDEGNLEFLAVAVKAHPILIQDEFAVVQTIRFIEKRLD